MTTIFPETNKCFLCGAEQEYCVVASTNTFGPMDLDTRPSEMKRSTMEYWVQTCPVCGYTATDVSDDTTVSKEFLKTEAYKTCDGIPFIADLAKEFYRHYLIQVADHQEKEAFPALLHAAWACDDKNDEINAVLMREKAIEAADQLLKSDVLNRKDTLSLIRADLLRRASRFDELIKEYSPEMYKDQLLKEIISFEIELAKRKCTECMTVKDARDYADGHFSWAD